MSSAVRPSKLSTLTHIPRYLFLSSMRCNLSYNAREYTSSGICTTNTPVRLVNLSCRPHQTRHIHLCVTPNCKFSPRYVRTFILIAPWL